MSRTAPSNCCYKKAQYIQIIFDRRIRSVAEVQEAYGQPRADYQATPAPAPASATAAKPTVQQRLQELDKLASGGYITPQEYKAKKKAILDSL